MTARNLMIDADTDEGAVVRPLTVGDLLKPVMRHKLLLLAIVLVFLGAAVAFLAVVEPRYTAWSVVLIKPTTPESVVGEARERLRLTVDQDEVRSQIEVIRSRALLELVTERLNLASMPDFNPSLKPSFLPELRETVGTFLDNRVAPWLDKVSPSLGHMVRGLHIQGVLPSDPVWMLEKRLEVNALNRSHAVEIALDTHDPELGVDVVNAVADAYQAYTLQMKSSITGAASAQLAERIEELQGNIGKAEQRIEEIRRDAGMMQGRTSTLLAERVSDVSAELFRVRSQAENLATKQRVLDDALRKNGDLSAAIDVSTSPVIGGLRQREAEMRARVAQISANRGEKNPQVMAAYSELNDVQRFIRAELRKISTALSSELSVARQREEALRKEFETLSADVSGTGQAELVIKSLEREVTTDRAVLATFMSRLKSLRLQDTLEKPDVQIISRASMSMTPSYPKAPMVLGLSLVTSLVVGFAAATILEHRDTSFRRLEDVERETGIPVAAVLPMVSDLRGPTPEERVVSHPTGMYAESVKQLLVSTCRNRVGGGAIKLLVTSSLSGEGKTTTAVALGRMASACGFRALIVDGDLRQRSISRLLNLPMAPGLMEVLNGEASLDDGLQTDAVSGAHVLPAGLFSPDKQRALNVLTLRAVFIELERQYDLIVIDTSPMLAVSDPQYFLDVADTSLFVVQWGRTPRTIVRTALKQMENANAAADAIILSKVDPYQQAAYGVGEYGNYKARLRHYYSK